MFIRSNPIIKTVLLIALVAIFSPVYVSAFIPPCQNGSKKGEYKCFENNKTTDLLNCSTNFACDLPSGLLGTQINTKLPSEIGLGNRTCCQIPDVGESGEKCFDKDRIAQNKLVDSGLGFITDSISKQSACISIFNICPANIVSESMKNLSASVSKSLGIDSAGNAAFACKTGIPDPQYVDENGNIPDKYLVKDNVLCQCINPERNPANAVVKMCLQHVAQVPIEFARLKAHDTAFDGVWTRSLLNNGDRIAAIIHETPPAAVWSNMIAQLGDGNLWKNKDPSQLEYARVRYGECVGCALSGGYPSAIGCLPLDNVGKFIAETVFGIGLSIAGAICLLCIIYSAIMLQTSQGSSEQVEKARKTLIQCLSGLVFIIFSIFILRFIGVNLLRIYGLS